MPIHEKNLIEEDCVIPIILQVYWNDGCTVKQVCDEIGNVTVVKQRIEELVKNDILVCNEEILHLTKSGLAIGKHLDAAVDILNS